MNEFIFLHIIIFFYLLRSLFNFFIAQHIIRNKTSARCSSKLVSAVTYRLIDRRDSSRDEFNATPPITGAEAVRQDLCPQYQTDILTCTKELVGAECTEAFTISKPPESSVPEWSKTWMRFFFFFSLGRSQFDSTISMTCLASAYASFLQRIRSRKQAPCRLLKQKETES